MATIEEIEARVEDVQAAEAAALTTLAEVMRELAVNLPDDSKLPLHFAKAAKTLDVFAGGSEPGQWGGGEMRSFAVKRYRELAPEND